MRHGLMLLLVVASAAVLVPNRRAHARDARTLWLYNIHTREEVRLRPFGAGGRLDTLAWRRLNRFFRSWRTDHRRTMHPRLVRTLRQVQRHFGGRRLEVISGYRVPDDRDAPTSFHGVGRACDLRIQGVDKRALFDYCRQLQASAPLGCGYYPNTTFVHIDVRGRAAIWVDNSGPGQSRRYVKDPARWLRTHR